MRKATTDDYDRILALNEASVHVLSPLTREKLEALATEADLFEVLEIDGRVEAFVLALREEKSYESINYLWFSDHYDRFLYVDRIVISKENRGAGLGRKLYENVFDHAGRSGVPRVAAEIDIQPPNPTSLQFHRHFGFREVGRQSVAGGKKIVSLQIADPN
jgi:predicted GNAT superfamily acetyltransferase